MDKKLSVFWLSYIFTEKIFVRKDLYISVTKRTFCQNQYGFEEPVAVNHRILVLFPKSCILLQILRMNWRRSK